MDAMKFDFRALEGQLRLLGAGAPGQDARDLFPIVFDAVARLPPVRF